MIGIAGDLELKVGAERCVVVTAARDVGSRLSLLVVHAPGDKPAADDCSGEVSSPEALIDAARDHRVPVVLVVDELRPWTFEDLLLKYPCIRNLITTQEVDDFDFIGSAEEASRASEPGHGCAIGKLWPMPAESDAYEARRFLSLNSRSMAPFLRSLRAVLGDMDRPRPALPWDPADTKRSPSVDKAGRLVLGNGFVNLADLVAHAREDAVRSLLMGDGDRGKWTSLPPPLLITGESGTGKSLLVKLIHERLTPAATEDGRRGQLVEVAVAGMDVKHFDHEFFGATSRAWADIESQVGLATQAAYGTLFLDELGDMPYEAQTRLLRFFNDLQIRIFGTTYSFFPYMHLVAATNRDLGHLISLGTFRHDLHARFRARLELPPLSQRTSEERARLVDFVAQNPDVNPLRDGDEPGERVVSHISRKAHDVLVAHEYRDGNFRDLERVVHDAIWMARNANRRTVEVADLKNLDPPRHRPDRESNDVAVNSIPAAETVVEVANLEDLRRLAAQSGATVLRSGDAHAVITDRICFRVDDHPMQPDGDVVRN